MLWCSAKGMPTTQGTSWGTCLLTWQDELHSEWSPKQAGSIAESLSSTQLRCTFLWHYPRVLGRPYTILTLLWRVVVLLHQGLAADRNAAASRWTVDTMASGHLKKQAAPLVPWLSPSSTKHSLNRGVLSGYLAGHSTHLYVPPSGMRAAGGPPVF